MLLQTRAVVLESGLEILPNARSRHFGNNSKEKRTIQRMSAHMINRSLVMLSRCHSHRMCFCADAGSGIGKMQEDGS